MIWTAFRTLSDSGWMLDVGCYIQCLNIFNVSLVFMVAIKVWKKQEPGTLTCQTGYGKVFATLGTWETKETSCKHSEKAGSSRLSIEQARQYHTLNPEKKTKHALMIMISGWWFQKNESQLGL